MLSVVLLGSNLNDEADCPNIGMFPKIKVLNIQSPLGMPLEILTIYKYV